MKSVSPKPKARRPRRAAGASRIRAAAIARARVTREMIDCEVLAELPAGYSEYGRRPPPKNCWYVVCGPRYKYMTGGSRTLLCVSKRSGRVLFTTVIHGE